MKTMIVKTVVINKVIFKIIQKLILILINKVNVILILINKDRLEFKLYLRKKK